MKWCGVTLHKQLFIIIIIIIYTKDNKYRWEKPKKTKISHYNNKHTRPSGYFETKNPFDLFSDETSYDSESEDEINFRREGS